MLTTDTLERKTLAISAIERGTVIDHIVAGRALNIVSLLRLSDCQKQVTLAINLPSGSMGYKDIIKLEDRRLDSSELNKVAILSPYATLNIIENYEVVEKVKIETPKEIRGLVSCPNPQCITNHEPMSTGFCVEEFRQNIRLRCCYCGKHFSQQDITC